MYFRFKPLTLIIPLCQYNLDGWAVLKFVGLPVRCGTVLFLQQHACTDFAPYHNAWFSQYVSGLNFSRSLPHQPLQVLFPNYNGLVCWKPAFCAHRVWRNSSFYQEVQRSLYDYRDCCFREQRACVKFCFKLGKNATECYEMLKAAFGVPKLNPVNGKVRGHLDRRRQGKWQAT